jgi:PAS domain S-box-containing protein
LGKIFIANKKVQSVFGYDPEKILNFEIEMLMPKIIARHHREYMTACIETGKLVIINKEREMFGISSQGHAFPIKLFITLDIGMHSGLNYFGCILPMLDHHDYILTDGLGIIDSASARISEICHIDPKLIRKLRLNIFSMCKTLRKIYAAFNRKLSSEVIKAQQKDNESENRHNLLSSIGTSLTQKLELGFYNENEEELEEIYQKFSTDGDFVRFDIPEDLVYYKEKIAKREQASKKGSRILDSQKGTMTDSEFNNVDGTALRFQKGRTSQTSVAATLKFTKNVSTSPKAANGTTTDSFFKLAGQARKDSGISSPERKGKRKKINYENIAFSIKYKLKINDELFRSKSIQNFP